MGAGSLEAALLAGVGLAAALLAVLLLRHWPHLSVVLWVLTICFVPYWAGVTVKVFLPPATLASVVIIAALLPVRRFRWHVADLVPALLLLGFLIATATGVSSASAGFTLVAEWIPAYIVGRFLAGAIDQTWIYGALAVALSVVAVLALVEFASAYNPFVHLVVGNDQFKAWGALQTRGGELRAEGAFGHSIALGASLALGIPLALGSRFRELVKIAMVGLMLAASVVTFSRIGMVSAVLGLLLSVAFLPGSLTTRARVILAGLLGVAAAVAIPFISSVFDTAGTEASNSAAYRGSLLSTLGSMNPLGLASSFDRTPSGSIYFSNFRSIDSALILIGLTYGLMALGLVIAALAAAVVVVLRGHATAATIAVVAQIPALTSVALITQYAALAWFTVGLAVTGQILRRRTDGPALPSGEKVTDNNHAILRGQTPCGPSGRPNPTGFKPVRYPSRQVGVVPVEPATDEHL